tara:strand:- start:5888 stop:6658 length:771 start_codon:yes stop_codon:yes gene_type:complete
MRLTTSNLFLGVTPTVTTGASTDAAANITDPDFSTSYTSVNNSDLSITFGAVSTINYVALAGLNIKGAGDYTSSVRLFDGATLITYNEVIRNNCVMLCFAARSFSSLKISLLSSTNTELIAVRFIAAGSYVELPLGGENAGYNRQWLNRNTKTKSTLSNLAAPTAVLIKNTSPTQTLTLPNMTKDFSEVTWQTFLDFTVSNFFFISEEDFNPSIGAATRNSSVYLCFDVTSSKASAHQSTRLMNNLAIKYRVFNGL